MNEYNGQPRRFAKILELEDLLLGLWMLAAEQLVVRYSGRSPVEWAEPNPDGSLPWPLILMLLAAAFVIFTRGSCDTSIDRAVLRRTLIFLPLFFVLPLIAAVVSLIRGGDKSVAKLGGDQAEWPMPAAPDWLRRLVATPILLVGDSAFLSAFQSEQRSFLGTEGGATFAGVVATLFLVALPYLIFIAGPRIAAGSSGDWKVWVARFAVYAVLLFTGRELAAVGFF
jgi:hypothetical protein